MSPWHKVFSIFPHWYESVGQRDESFGQWCECFANGPNVLATRWYDLFIRQSHRTVEIERFWPSDWLNSSNEELPGGLIPVRVVFWDC